MTTAADGRLTRRTLVLALFMAFLVAVSAYGIVAANQSDPGSGDLPGDPITAAQGLGTPLAAVGSLTGLPEPCTAWLVALEGSSEATAHAVTAGRCLGIEDSATVLVDEELDGVTLTMRAFAEAGGRPSPVAVPVTAVAWASMRTVDAAVLTLAADYAGLAAQGIRPIVVADAVDAGQVLVAGVPGVPEADRVVRGTRCAAGAPAQVLESPWLWPALLTTDCAGAWVGSPALDASGRAVGILSTSTIGSQGEPDCYQGRPCAASPEGVTVEPSATYLSPVPDLRGCFGDQGGPSCGLEDPRDVVEASAQSPSARPGAPVQITVDAAPASVGVRSGEVGQVACADPQRWRTVPVQDGRLSVPMPLVPTFAVVCVGSPESPTPLVIEADPAAPDSAALELEQIPVAGAVAVSPLSRSPRITSFLWAAAPTGSIDCATADGYGPYRRPAVYEVADLPVTVCVIGVDAAGSSTAPVGFEVPLPGE